jgi:tetratricopeptide (TPR) repeat protein
MKTNRVVLGFVILVIGSGVAAQRAQANAGRQQSSSAASGSGQNASAQSGAAQAKKTPEEIEAAKKQAERAQKMNTLITQANAAVAAKNWQEALAPLRELTDMDTANWQFFSALGDAQLNLGQYDDAVATYKSGIAAVGSNALDPQNPSAAKNRVSLGHMLTSEGNAYLKLKKNNEAVAAYTKAAALDPNPGVAYFNLCATQYNTGNVDGALDACDKAIAADPNKADAYFIKGSLLIASSKTDEAGKVTPPTGTAEALKKYLELKPDGPHASDVKQMLEYIGSKVETTYKPKGKP